MKKLTTHLTRLGAAALIMATAACSGVAGNDPAPAPVVNNTPAPVAAATPARAPITAGKTLMEQIKAEIGNAPCDSSQQCRSLPVGSRACGGPESYLPYSTKVSDAAKLQRLATQDSAARKEQDAKSGMISTCQMIMDPGATCSAGRCVAATGSGGQLPTQ